MSDTIVQCIHNLPANKKYFQMLCLKLSRCYHSTIAKHHSTRNHGTNHMYCNYIFIITRNTNSRQQGMIFHIHIETFLLQFGCNEVSLVMIEAHSALPRFVTS